MGQQIVIEYSRDSPMSKVKIKVNISSYFPTSCNTLLIYYQTKDQLMNIKQTQWADSSSFSTFHATALS
jgi:hypothetical protein